MKCRKCGYENKSKAKFCSNCGALLENICPSCGAVNKSEASFCTACGASLNDCSEVSKLVALARQNDQTAITRLYDITKKKYMTICRQILQNSRTTGDMEDVLQDQCH